MTKPTTVDEIRKAYLDFFEAKGHLVVPSASLIPVGDPTLLLTSAGMVQFKPYFTGEETPPNPRLASVQKCFRTSDIDAVGDTKHLTFFEMLGNFSIGDYFKKEAIAWGWEFVTEVLGLPPENLWVTYYEEPGEEDLEAKGYWLEATKGRLPESHIVALGAEHNWWGPAGEEGPSGPCSEIHYSYEPERTTIDDLTGDSPRTVEIWNLVFTQFYHHRDGKRTTLPKPNIDTGMGLERTAAVMQGVVSVYGSDALDYLVDEVARLAGTSYGKNKETDDAIRIAAEHARGITFLIVDGVVPSNEGRGYVLRRILRRAVRFARKAGVQPASGGFLAELSAAVLERMGEHYPELRRQREVILSVVQGEEERFGQTLEAGMEIFQGMFTSISDVQRDLAALEQSVEDIDAGTFEEEAMHDLFSGLRSLPFNPGVGPRNNEFAMGGTLLRAQFGEIAQNAQSYLQGELADRALNEKASAATDLINNAKRLHGIISRSIPGDIVFKLYDSYGLTPDITQDIAREHGMEVDLEGFEREMEAQRERGRAGAKFITPTPATVTASLVAPSVSLGGSRFTGYESLSEETVVIGLLVGGAPVERASKGDRVEVVLRETPFYAEAGGQVGDSGELRGPLGAVRVSDTQAPLPGVIAHLSEVVEGEIAVGEPVQATVDSARRSDIVRNHTATHMLHAALRRILGSHVRQAGSLVAPDRLRFDFSHPSSIGQAELHQVETLINDKVMENLAVAHQVMPYSEAMAQGALAFFGDKYGDTVRTCRIGDPSTSSFGVAQDRSGQAQEPFSFELCGGTHTGATGEIGLVHLEGEGSIGAGTRRLEAVTGHGAEGLLRERHLLMESLAKQLQTAPGELSSRVGSLLAELDRERKRATAMERDLARRAAESLAGQVQLVDGVSVLTAQVPASSGDALRDMGDWLKAKLGSAVIVLGATTDDGLAFVAMVTPDLVSKGHHAGNIVREVAKVAGGGGGGRPELAQAGGKDKGKLQEALALVPELVRKG